MSSDPAVLDKPSLGNKSEMLGVWAKQHCQLYAQPFDSHGVGLKALSNTRVQASVPESLVFCKSTIENLAEKDSVLKRWISIDKPTGVDLIHRTLVYLTLFQNHEPWFLYMKLLPNANDMDLPFAWSIENMEALTGTSIYEAVLAKHMFLRNAYEAFFKSDEARSIVSQAGAQDVTLQQWLIAYQWIASRGLTHPETGETCIVPVVDMCNHSSEANVRYEFEDGAFIITPIRELEPGQELVLDYGKRSPGDFLHNYGFIPSDLKMVSLSLCKFYDPRDPNVRAILDASLDPSLEQEGGNVQEIRDELKCAYQILSQFVTLPKLELAPNEWKDDFVCLITLESDVELTVIEEQHALCVGGEELSPGTIKPHVNARKDALTRANRYISLLCSVFAERVRDAGARADRRLVQRLCAIEEQIYRQAITLVS